MKKKSKFYFIVLALLLLVFIFSGYRVISYYLTLKNETVAFTKLSESKNYTDGFVKATEHKSILTRYFALYEQNTDLFGWITIAGTKLDYPVMHTPNEAEYYLRRAFDKSYSQSGVPFLSADCFEDCGNYIVYGHNMKNGTMFAPILDYKDKEFWQEHKIICFDTIYEQAQYEVIAAFRTEINETDQDGFHYYHYTDLTNNETFDEFIKHVERLSLYDTEIETEFGDQFLTLSTCAYHTNNGRFVVVAKKLN